MYLLIHIFIYNLVNGFIIIILKLRVSFFPLPFSIYSTSFASTVPTIEARKNQ